MAKKVTATDFDGKSHQVEVSELVWRPSAYGVVIKNGKLLLLRQKNGYDLPGGGINLGETSETAVIREIKEETGTTASNPRLLGITNSFYIAFRSGNKCYHGLMMYYACDYIGGELSTDGFDEGEQQYAEAPEWVPLDKLDGLKIGSSNDFRPYVKQALKL